MSAFKMLTSLIAGHPGYKMEVESYIGETKREDHSCICFFIITVYPKRWPGQMIRLRKDGEYHFWPEAVMEGLMEQAAISMLCLLAESAFENSFEAAVNKIIQLKKEVL